MDFLVILYAIFIIAMGIAITAMLTRIHKTLRGMSRKLYKIEKQNFVLLKTEARLMGVVEDIGANVEKLTSVKESVIALLRAWKAQIDQGISSGNLEKLQAANTKMGESIESLAQSVIANTPAAEGEPGDGTGTPSPTDPTAEETDTTEDEDLIEGEEV